MLNNDSAELPVNPRAYKRAAYSAWATVIKAMASPKRLELLDLLVQGPRRVESLARGTAQPMATASQHLQVLKRAHLVETRRLGVTIEYRLAPGVGVVLAGLRDFALLRSPELRVVQAERYVGIDAISREELVGLLQGDAAVLVDVRPEAEFAAGHIEGARSIPVAELEAQLVNLPPDRLVVATCRGPYCVFAADAVELLRAHGFSAVRFEDGVAEWEAAGGRVVR